MLYSIHFILVSYSSIRGYLLTMLFFNNSYANINATYISAPRHIHLYRFKGPVFDASFFTNNICRLILHHVILSLNGQNANTCEQKS